MIFGGLASAPLAGAEQAPRETDLGPFEDLSHGDGGKFVHNVGGAANELGSGVAGVARDTVGAVVGSQ